MRLLFFPLRVREKEGPPRLRRRRQRRSRRSGLSPSFLAPAWIKADREEEEDVLGEEGRERD